MKAEARRRASKAKGDDAPRRKRTVMFVILTVIIGLCSYEVFVLALRPHLDEFTANAIASLISLLLVPLILLIVRTPIKRLRLGKLDLGLIISLAVYQLFGLWIIAYYWVDAHYFKRYDLGSMDYLNYIILVGAYVAPVDFMTRRIVQYEVTATFGTWNGFWAGTVAWLVGHVLEVMWLSELMGPAGSATFIVVSGLVTGLLYMKFKNVLGLMLGHWVINIIISIVTSSVH